MAKENGTGGRVKIGANAVAEINNWSLNDQVNKVTGRAFGESVETAAAGARTVTGTFKGFYDPTDTNGQVALAVGATVALELYTDGEATGDHFLAISEALIESQSIDTQNDQYVTVDISFHANVVPVPSTAA